jgi:hypothetical protein
MIERAARTIRNERFFSAFFALFPLLIYGLLLPMAEGALRSTWINKKW